MKNMSCCNTRIIQVTSGGGGGPYIVQNNTPNQGDVTVTDSSGDSFVIPAPIVNQLTDADNDTYIELIEGGAGAGGDKMEFVVDGQTVGSVEILADGNEKWEIRGILDPLIYAGTPQTTIQRDVFTPVTGYMIYNSDNTCYEFYNGIEWVAMKGISDFTTLTAQQVSDLKTALGLPENHASITSIDLKSNGNPNEYIVEVVWVDSDGNSQTTTDPTPITISGATDLAYVVDPAKGTVTSSTGLDVDLPLVDAINAGLMSPSDKTNLDSLVTNESIQDTLISNKVDKPVGSTQGFIATVDATGNDVEYIPASIASPASQADVTSGTANPNEYVQADTLKVELNKKINISDVQDNLTSTTLDPLSANQGKELKDALDAEILSTDNEQIAQDAAIALNTAKVSADGSVTTHSDVTDAGSGAIITVAERANIHLDDDVEGISGK